MTSMLAELLGTIAEEIRATLPPVPSAANDEDSQQLLRQLSDSGLLDHADLIALLLRRADEERIANACAPVPAPRGGFLQALIADEDEGISASAMALILARGRRRNRLGQPRIEFEDLPEQLANMLAHSVAACASTACARSGAEGRAPSVREGSRLASAVSRRRKGDRRADSRPGQDAQPFRLSRRAAAGERGGRGRCRVPRRRRLVSAPGSAASGAWDYLADGDDGRLVLLLRLAGVSRDFAAKAARVAWGSRRDRRPRNGNRPVRCIG